MEPLKAAVEYITRKCANETESGTYFIYADDFPTDILPPELFAAHVHTLAAMMLNYASIAEVGIEGDTISIIMHLDYCQNYVPSLDEAHKFPNGKKILDPLAKKHLVEIYANSHST